MTLSFQARSIIGQAIIDSAVSYSLGRSPEQLARVVDGIERDLEAADYVVISRSELTTRIEDGPNEREYQDGQ